MPSLIAYAVRSDCTVVSESELSPEARAIIQKMGRVAYVLDCHRQAVNKHSSTMAELRTELKRIKVTR